MVDDRYELLDRVGSGGTADVYSATDLALSRKVALKVLRDRLAYDVESVERFRRESRSVAGLRHENIVSIYDRGEWGGTHYLVMEYVPGRSLKAIVREEAPLDPARAIDFTAQILKAAHFIHQRGIIHRDLKPGNVLVDGSGSVKITDFGIALDGSSDITQTGSIIGTVRYMSPEQAQGRTLSGASDIYSIGIILYELLAARAPFEHESAVAVALKHANETPVPPAPSIPPSRLSWMPRSCGRSRRIPRIASGIPASSWRRWKTRGRDSWRRGPSGSPARGPWVASAAIGWPKLEHRSSSLRRSASPFSAVRGDPP